jgi:hypothetical protein
MTANKIVHLSVTLLLSTLVAGCGGNISGNNDVTLSEASLSSNEHTAFNFFVAKGLTKVQSAGIVGNLMQESNVIPTSVQFGGGPGRGIAQWSVGGRWDASASDNVAWFAAVHGQNRWALGTQLDFIWYELTNLGYGFSELRAAGSVTAATLAFQDRFEICGQCDASTRIQYADQVLSQFGGGGGGGAGCYSHTLAREMPDNACVQSRFDGLWYQCANGAWVDRWSDPAPCNGVHPL